ncbi:ASCH domain-containing protein [Streptomyces sp. SID4985]|uniref:ASCH domain-containing protein n=1 Tax=Streptomyces sp. SID4985 TaxID=2690292 RepID=UPI0013681BB4|nr:ASCH domain-containing protein [Streptomyces sp. SID4985]MYQ45470.1 ASCH domain-containing protein [Streptomyces sp. SID4985]
MTDSTTRVHELNLYRQYFDLVAAGTKTIEVRVKYPHLSDLATGDIIRFRVKHTDETCDVRVLRVTEYADFETMLDTEGPHKVNPTADRERQLTNIRAIYPPDKETLGVLAVEIERV